MPAWMTYVMNHDVMRFAQMACRIWNCKMDFSNPKKTAEDGIAAFKLFLKSIGMPLTFAELGAREEDIPTLVKNFGIGDGTTAGFVHLSAQDVTNIYRLAL